MSDPSLLSTEPKKAPRPDVPRYFRVASHLWHDELVREWPDQMKLFLVYLLTNRHRTIEGLYVIPPEYAAADMRWPLARVKKMFTKVEEAGCIRYDSKNNLLLIRNALRYQQPENPLVVKGVMARLRGLPDNQEFMHEFIALARFHCRRPGLTVHAQGFPDLLEKEFLTAPKGPQPVRLASNSSST